MLYITSFTTQAATTLVINTYKKVLCWLKNNRLSVNAAKTKLMTFTKVRSKKDLRQHPRCTI